MVTMDFGSIRLDSYLPPKQRAEAQAFFHRLANNDQPTVDKIARDYGMIMSSRQRIGIWAARFGNPVLQYGGGAFFTPPGK